MILRCIEWFPVCDGLPDDESTVLVCSPEGSEPVWPGFHDATGWHHVDRPATPIVVTHWAEMPASPAEVVAGDEFAQEQEALAATHLRLAELSRAIAASDT